MEFQLANSGSVDDFEGMVAERKLDGSRGMMRDGKIVNRRGRHYHHKLPEIEISEDMVLDGEVITHDFEFSSLQGRISTEDKFKIRKKSEECPAYFVAFDILEKGGEDLRDLPFEERKEHLDVEDLDHVLEATTHEDPEALWKEATHEGWEGIMLKDPDANYRGDRRDAWLKVKTWEEGVFDVVDHKTTENDGTVVRIDIGTDEPQKVVVNGHEDQEKLPNANQVEVQYLERSDSNRLRKPSFKRVA